MPPPLLNFNTTLESGNVRAVQAILESRDQKGAFIALLVATAASVTKKPAFNLELEMNDLWTKLSVLKGPGWVPTSPLAGVSRMVSENNERLANQLAAMQRSGGRR